MYMTGWLEIASGKIRNLRVIQKVSQFQYIIKIRNHKINKSQKIRIIYFHPTSIDQLSYLLVTG